MWPHVAGILDVHVVEAEGVPQRCLYGPQDVYARVMCSNGGAALHTRTAKQGGGCPVFNHRLQLGIPEGEAEVRLELWMASHNRGTAGDQLLGSAQVPIEGMLLEGSKSVPMEFSLTNDEDGCEINAGVVRIYLSYHARLQSSASKMSRNGASPLTKALAGILSNSRITQNNNYNNNNFDSQETNNATGNSTKSTSNANNSNGVGSKRCSPEASFESPMCNFRDYATDAEVQSPRAGKRNRTLLWDLDNSLPESRSESDNPVRAPSLLKLGSLCLPDIDVGLVNNNSFKQGFLLSPRDEPKSCSFSPNNPSPNNPSPNNPSPNNPSSNSPYLAVTPFATCSSLEQQKLSEPILSLWEAPAPAPISPSPEWGLLETIKAGEGVKERQVEDEVISDGQDVAVVRREPQPSLVKHDLHNFSLREGLGRGGEEETLEVVVTRSGQELGEFQSQLRPVTESHGGGKGEVEVVRVNSSAGIDLNECHGNMFFGSETFSGPELPGIQNLHFGCPVESVTGNEKKTGDSHGWMESESEGDFGLASSHYCAGKSTSSGNRKFGPIRSFEGMMPTRKGKTLEACSPEGQILDPLIKFSEPCDSPSLITESLPSLRSHHATSLSNTVEQPFPRDKKNGFFCHQKSVSRDQQKQQQRLGVEETQRKVVLQPSSLQKQYLDFVLNQRKVAESVVAESVPAFGEPTSVQKGRVSQSSGPQELDQTVQMKHTRTEKTLSLLEQYCLRQQQQLELQKEIGIQLSQQAEEEAVRFRHESFRAERFEGEGEGVRVHKSMREDWFGGRDWPEEEPEKGEFENCWQYKRFMSDLIFPNTVLNQPESTLRVETGLLDVANPLLSNLVHEEKNVAGRERKEEDTINLEMPKIVHF